MNEKKSKPIPSRAWQYATTFAAKKAEKSWSDAERGTYWWGLYDGYQAGMRAARRQK